MLTHVLVAVDFSPATQLLIARLNALCALGVKQATLVHVLSTRYPSAPAETHRAIYEDQLKQLAGQCERGISVQTRIETGMPGYTLVQAAKELRADLILAGKSGYRRWRELLLGSTALDLARLTDRPLWLEPTGPEEKQQPQALLRSVLLATDGSESAKPAEELFTQLAAEFQRAIALNVVAALDQNDIQIETSDAERSLAEIAAKVDGLQTIIVPDGDPPIVIAQTAQREDIDLIIVGKRGRSPIQGLMLGSTAEAVCRRSQRSVLLVPARQQ